MSRDLSLALLAYLVVVGDVVLLALGHDVPPLMETLSVASVGAVAGAAVPKRSAP